MGLFYGQVASVEQQLRQLQVEANSLEDQLFEVLQLQNSHCRAWSVKANFALTLQYTFMCLLWTICFSQIH